ncbi:MAG: hypothetical protein WC269_04545 [Candidatus Gracilibacteria bacterium]|jgi:hypothetical protein
MKDLMPIPQETKEFSKEERILMITCSKLAVYAKKCNWAGLKEVEDLLTGMERSVMCIQRRKKNILEKRNRKLNMLAAKANRHGNSWHKHGGGKKFGSAGGKNSKKQRKV